MVTIEQRRKTDRERRERWRKRKLAEGCKQIQLMLSPKAQAILKHEKSRTGEPYVQIVHRAIINLEMGLPSISAKNMTQPIISEMSRARASNSGKTKPRTGISDKKKVIQHDQLKLF